MEFFNKLGHTQKLIAIFVALFVFFTLGGVVMAHMAGHAIEWEKQLSEGFYYAAIGFAVYHMFTRNKQRREEKEAGEKQAASSENAPPVDAGEEKAQ